MCLCIKKKKIVVYFVTFLKQVAMKLFIYFDIIFVA